MHSLRILLTALVFLIPGLAWSSPTDVESDFDAKIKDYRRVEGATDEAFCGGNSVTVFLDGKYVRKIDYFMETSSQSILREYYYERGQAVVGRETIYNLRDANGVEYKRPRPGTKTTVFLGDGRNSAVHRDFRKQSKYLLKYFRKHEADFK